MVKTTPAVKPGHIYNKSETAQMLGISRGTLRKYTRLQRIEPYFHPLTGSEYYTAESIVEAWERRMGKSVPETQSVAAAIGRFNLDAQPSPTFDARINSFRTRGK
jgi:hypothetical protein